MATTSVNRQPMLVDRPLIEVEVLTTAAVGNRNNDDYKVQGGQGPVLLVDMDTTLTDDDVSGGLIDTIEVIRNEAVADADVTISPTVYSSEFTYTTGAIAYVPSGAFGTLNYLSVPAVIPIDYTISPSGYAEEHSYAYTDMIAYVPSGGFAPVATFDTSVSGVIATYTDQAYFQVLTSNVVTSSGQLPSGIGIYQYSGSTISGLPGDTTFTSASGFNYLAASSGTAPSGYGYYRYRGGELLTYNQTTQFTSDNFEYLGVNAPIFLTPYTFTDKSFYFITSTGIVPNSSQVANGPGLYQYRGDTVSGRIDTITYSSGNGYYFLGTTSGTAPNGSGYYRYTAASPLTIQEQATQFTGTNGFSYISPTLPTAFDPLEICFYHVRQKVNPIANDGDYKFVGKISIGSGVSRTDGLAQLPHLSIPVPYTHGSLEVDTPGRNRGLYLQKGDSLYCGIYATSATTVNYTPGVTVLAQGGYY
jgi:hypothetical protein